MKPQKLKQTPGNTRFIAYVAASIDGRISLTTQKRPDWTSTEDWKFFQKELGKADAVVVGRNTYLAAKARLQKRNTFVFTSTIQKTQTKDGATFVNPQHTDLAKLFREYERIAIVGGSRVYRTMLQNNLLDELYVTLEPLIFGRGTEMFSGGKSTAHMKLMVVKKLNTSGTLLLRYKKI